MVIHTITIDMTDGELIETAQSAPTTEFIQICRDYLYNLRGYHLYRFDEGSKWHVVTVSKNYHTQRPEFKKLCDVFVPAHRRYGMFWLSVDGNELNDLSLMGDLCKNCTRTEKWRKQWLASQMKRVSTSAGVG